MGISAGGLPHFTRSQRNRVKGYKGYNAGVCLLETQYVLCETHDDADAIVMNFQT